MNWWWWWIVFVELLTEERHLALLPAGTVFKDSHHCKYPTRCEPGLNLRRIWVQTLWSCAVLITTKPRRSGFYTKSCWGRDKKRKKTVTESGTTICAILVNSTFIGRLHLCSTFVGRLTSSILKTATRNF